MSERLQTKADVLAAKVADVETVYNGKDDCCRCGCGGDYQTPEANPRVVKLRLARIQAAILRGEPGIEEGANYVNYSYGEDRALCVYLKAFNGPRAVSDPQLAPQKQAEPEAFAIMRGEAGA